MQISTARADGALASKVQERTARIGHAEDHDPAHEHKCEKISLHNVHPIVKISR
jgi:hypothetical protein